MPNNCNFANDARFTDAQVPMGRVHTGSMTSGTMSQVWVWVVGVLGLYY